MKTQRHKETKKNLHHVHRTKLLKITRQESDKTLDIFRCVQPHLADLLYFVSQKISCIFPHELLHNMSTRLKSTFKQRCFSRHLSVKGIFLEIKDTGKCVFEVPRVSDRVVSTSKVGHLRNNASVRQDISL